ncbi:efflux RND transporter permease subunit [Psychroflexus sp. ALD_RP9]|uniref:efflux RND transporter permease subunit n=1 Tax=Psychroflexus sp. ALD_RP9 TaxID=2777186 RepID=UPI001A8D227F|nr:efflux RND transporter permease subunit [Psychroflexus sp. ALD_RP9]QSS97699.1 efflux RND transporter permease subunit [Psychroflexus sp. ALD_RP9]
MKKLITYFIKYEVAVNVVILSFIIFGIVGALSLKSSFFPLQESKIININITYPGSSPEEIEEGIILKIEDNLKGLEGIDRTTAVARESGGSITVEIEEGEDIDVLLTEVKNAVDRVPNFPVGMEPLVVAKTETTRQTIQFAISGENIPLKTLKDISYQVESDLRLIDGISQIEIRGFPREEIEIALSQDALLAYNLSFEEVAAKVRNSNLLSTGGTIKTNAEDYLIRADNRSYYADKLNDVIVKSTPSGSSILLSDVAKVRDQFEETPNALFYNGDSAVTMVISNTNSEDLISSADAIKEYIANFNAKNNNVQLNVVSDSSITLNQRTKLLIENGAVGILLVLIFLSIFLNIRLALWVSVGLPLSFLGMFIFANAFGVTINVLSLFGMIIVIGILVDDGIVIAENIYQQYEKGKSPIRAAIDGAVEVIPPIISAIVTTILAFSTFFFLEGRIGEFFSEVSVIVLLTLSVSLIEAFLILPAHIAHSKAIRPTKKKLKKRTLLGRFFSKMRHVNSYGDRVMRYLRDNSYAPVLRFVINNRLFSIAILIAALALTIGSVGGGIIRVTFFPSVASDRVEVSLLMTEGVNPQKTDSIISIVEEAAWRVNKTFTEKQTDNLQVIENTVKRVGPGNNKASLQVNLLPGEARDFSSAEITNAIREETGPIYGVESITFGSGSNFGGLPVSVSLLGNNLAELESAKVELRNWMENNAQLKDVTDNDPKGIKEIEIDLKTTAYALGLDLGEVMRQVRNAFFGAQAQRFQRGKDEIRVWVRYNENQRSSIRNLDDLRIITPNGSRVAFNEIANYQIVRGTESISYLNGRREIQVSADLENPNDSSTEILDEIRTTVMPDILNKYSSLSVSYEGQNREAGKTSGSAGKVFPVILFLIFVVIAFTFRSFSQPIMLILLIPFSLIGVAWGHYIHGFPINILSLLGVIALIGIMVNDGLVLIGKFNSNLREGLKFNDALFEAGKSRFRAIFLTSLTTISGLAPLIFEQSRQAQFLIPMAISIAYGIGVATVLTLILLPILLSISNSIKVKSKWLFTGNQVEKEQVERAIKEQLEEDNYNEK